MVESGTHPWVEITCSFYFNSSEYNQLDMKWYYNNQEEPFLQWVPSSGRQPQTIGQRFKGRIETRHSLSNDTEVMIMMIMIILIMMMILRCSRLSKLFVCYAPLSTPLVTTHVGWLHS